MTVLEKLAARLRDLPSDELVELLVRAAEENPKLKKELVDKTADVKDLTAAAKRGITALTKLDAETRILDASKISRKVEDLVRQIDRLGERAPNEAFALLCNLLGTEQHIHEEVDDSSGLITDAFRVTLMKSAARLVGRCHNNKMLLTAMRTACLADPFGTVALFIDAVGPSLPDEIVETLLTDLGKRPVAAPHASGHHFDANVEMRKRLLVAIGDIERFTELCGSTTGLHGRDMLTIAEMYIEHDDLQGAEQTLAKITDARVIEMPKFRELQFRIWRSLGKHDAINAMLRSDVLSHPRRATLNTYRSACGEEAANDVIKDLAAKVEAAAKKKQPSNPNALILLTELGYGEKMTDMVTHLQKAPLLNFGDLLNLARTFQTRGLFLGASLVLRIMINRILDEGRSTEYTYAASWVVNLQTWSRHITDWHGLPDHREYYDQIHKKHERKTAFWAAVRRGW
ncbi:MAG: hypothetical protein EHM43_10545 [Ignavibacteriae bacterium]|nr:MAG: hypothetical protein EHM43_10545 [Ignavibacteriota bacterium]